MIKSRSSVESPFFANTCGWACAVFIIALATFAIFQVFVSLQAHVQEEVVSIANLQMER